MEVDHRAFMRLALAEAELARGTTGDNPWVGCVIVDARGEVIARGRTQGPGENHAEIAAVRAAAARGREVRGVVIVNSFELNMRIVLRMAS